MFGITADLIATVKEIRRIESYKPSMTKFPDLKINPDNAYCNKRDMEAATAHLAKIKCFDRKPTSPATASAPVAASPQRPVAPKLATAPAGRSAAQFLALDGGERNQLIYSAMAMASRPLRDELRRAFASAAPSQRIEFASAFRAALHAHEPQAGPTISRSEFSALSPAGKMATVRAGIRIH